MPRGIPKKKGESKAAYEARVNGAQAKPAPAPKANGPDSLLFILLQQTAESLLEENSMLRTRYARLKETFIRAFPEAAKALGDRE